MYIKCLGKRFVSLISSKIIWIGCWFAHLPVSSGRSEYSWTVHNRVWSYHLIQVTGWLKSIEWYDQQFFQSWELLITLIEGLIISYVHCFLDLMNCYSEHLLRVRMFPLLVVHTTSPILRFAMILCPSSLARMRYHCWHRLSSMLGLTTDCLRVEGVGCLYPTNVRSGSTSIWKPIHPL